MHENRRFLRALLSRLIAERDDAQSLYIPRGEEGQRRMINALLSMRPTRQNDPLAQDIERFISPAHPRPASPKAAPSCAHGDSGCQSAEASPCPHPFE